MKRSFSFIFPEKNPFINLSLSLSAEISHCNHDNKRDTRREQGSHKPTRLPDQLFMSESNPAFSRKDTIFLVKATRWLPTDSNSKSRDGG